MRFFKQSTKAHELQCHQGPTLCDVDVTSLLSRQKLLDEVNIATALGGRVVIWLDNPEELGNTVGPVADTPSTKDGILAFLIRIAGVRRSGASGSPLEAGGVGEEGAVLRLGGASEDLNVFPA